MKSGIKFELVNGKLTLNNGSITISGCKEVIKNTNYIINPSQFEDLYCYYTGKCLYKNSYGRFESLEHYLCREFTFTRCASDHLDRIVWAVDENGIYLAVFTHELGDYDHILMRTFNIITDEDEMGNVLNNKYSRIFFDENDAEDYYEYLQSMKMIESLNNDNEEIRKQIAELIKKMNENSVGIALKITNSSESHNIYN